MSCLSTSPCPFLGTLLPAANLGWSWAYESSTLHWPVHFGWGELSGGSVLEQGLGSFWRGPGPGGSKGNVCVALSWQDRAHLFLRPSRYMVTGFGAKFPAAYNSSRERLAMTLRHQLSILFFALHIPTIEGKNPTKLPFPHSPHPPKKFSLGKPSSAARCWKKGKETVLVSFDAY